MLLGPHGFGVHGAFGMVGSSSRIISHFINGSPLYPGKQVHIGECDLTWQRALIPHTPGPHGSTHLLFLHALDISHSGLITHSGRQDGGEPIIFCEHEQIG